MTEGLTRRRETSVNSTEAEAGFGDILARVSQGERVIITRDDKREAVVLSARDYDALIGAEGVDLTALEREFDEMVGRMQEPRHRAGVDALLRMGSDELGNAFADETQRRSSSSR